MWNGDRNVVILRGVPGAGKSHLSKLLVSSFTGLRVDALPSGFRHLYCYAEPRSVHDVGTRHARSVRVVSADHHFIKPDGSYAFDPAQLHIAHHRCWLSFLEVIQARKDEQPRQEKRLIIVDNTNIGEAEIAPYVLPANALGWNVMIISVVTDRFETASARQQHGVPEIRLAQMWTRFGATQLPPWWTHFAATSDGTAPDDPGIPGATPVPQPVSEWRFQ